MHITRGSVTPTIKRLEDLGLVKRHIYENDGRRQWLTAAQEARDIADQVEAQALHQVLSAFQDWSEPTLRQFCDNLEKILSNPFLGEKPRANQMLLS
jgi:DNA-binding MarR family transcriptional regulator